MVRLQLLFSALEDRYVRAVRDILSRLVEAETLTGMGDWLRKEESACHKAVLPSKGTTV